MHLAQFEYTHIKGDTQITNMLAPCVRTQWRNSIHTLVKTIQPTIHFGVRRIHTKFAAPLHLPTNLFSSTLNPTSLLPSPSRSIAATIPRRGVSSWISSSRRSTPLSSTAAAKDYNSSQQSILVYATPAVWYLRGLAWVIIGVIFPTIAYLSYPFWQEQIEINRNRSNGASESSSSNSTLTRTYSRIVSSEAVRNSVLAANVGIGIGLAAILRFNSRLIYRIRLYPNSNTLSLELVGLTGRGAPKLVPVESVLPPLALSGHESALRCKLAVQPHPKRLLAHVAGFKGITGPIDIEPMREYHIFPLPNVAAKFVESPSDKEAVEQFWLRTLTTGVHTTEQMEELARINAIEPNDAK